MPKVRQSRNLEAKLQSECVLWYKNNHVNSRRELWATFNEGKDVNSKLSMGMTVGVPDLMHFGESGLTGIEMKYPGTGHNVKHLINQAEWLINVPSRGWFCDNLEEFKCIIGGGRGIDPVKVLKYCKSVKTKSIVWKREFFE